MATFLRKHSGFFLTFHKPYEMYGKTDSETALKLPCSKTFFKMSSFTVYIETKSMLDFS